MASREDGPHRVQRRRIKGWRLPPNTVVVSRPSRWGNPFTVANHGHAQAVRQYEKYLRQNHRLVEDVRRELAGKDLACWCRLDLPCHADVLLALANEEVTNDAG